MKKDDIQKSVNVFENFINKQVTEDNSEDFELSELQDKWNKIDLGFDKLIKITDKFLLRGSVEDNIIDNFGDGIAMDLDSVIERLQIIRNKIK